MKTDSGKSLLAFLAALSCGLITIALAAEGAEQTVSRQYNASEVIELKVDLAKQECFVGEPLILEVAWLSKQSWDSFCDVDLILPLLHDQRFKILDAPASFPVDTEKAVGVPVSETRILAVPRKRTIDKTIRNELAFKKIVIPRSAGMLEIDRAELRCALLSLQAREQASWNRYPSYFDNNFFEGEVPEGSTYIHAFSSAKSLKVNPLPPDQNISNIVAVSKSLRISVTADPKKVSAGDSIELQIELSGDTFPESISMPDVAHQLVDSGFEVDPFTATPRYEKNSIVYNKVVRPKDERIAEIPPLEAAYFDPDSETCKAVKSDPIPIQVAAARSINLEDAQGPGATGPEKPRYPTWAIVLALAVTISLALFVFGRRS